jgi:uncharacterized OsmC-like protein
MDAELLPGFQTRLTHGPSGSLLPTVAPKDNGGTGATFSPTDLVAAALLSCALTTMQLTSHREGIPFEKARGRIVKRMTPPPRRVAELSLIFEMPAGLSPVQRARLEEIARTCPVARSLHPDVRVVMEFRYPEPE